MDKIPYSVTVRTPSGDPYNHGSSGRFMVMAKARLACWLSVFGAVAVGYFLAAQPAGATAGRVFEAPNFAAGVLSPSPARAVATFESVSLYWRPGESAEARDCQVRYRPLGTEDWRAGYPLWYDDRNAECRGSLVMLTPDTEFEIELLAPASNALARLRARTWSETFPIGQTIYLPENSDETLVIEQSGRPDGYLLVAPKPGATATIDAAGRADSNILIKGSYVIVRGLRLKNAARNAIVLDKDISDIVIEENDISGWGAVGADGWARKSDSAIFSGRGDDASLVRVVIQRNKIHTPRSDSNAWDEYRRKSNSKHPGGPQGISLWNTDGNHVIRYNEIYSDEAHKFNDCIGAGSNFSDRGFPNRDTDIYGNKFSYCWDDAIESEGGNANVRIWGNYIDNSNMMVSVAATETGPIYIWRNVADRSRLSATREMANAKRGVFLKSQSKFAGKEDESGNKRFFGKGRIFVFHNTLVQRDGENYGVYSGLSDLSGMLTNVTSRNNILHVYADYRFSIFDSKGVQSNDFDYDLYNGKLRVIGDQEVHGLFGVPIYDPAAGDAVYALDPSSLGFDAGIILPNFSDGYVGAGPDMGAQEAGAAPLEFGVDAYR